MYLKRFLTFTIEMEDLISGQSITQKQCDYYLTQISFLQNERIAHLHVLIGVLISELLSMILLIMSPSIGMFLLFLLFFILLIPYIHYYYRLENLIQKWYLLYNKMLQILNSDKDD